LGAALCRSADEGGQEMAAVLQPPTPFVAPVVRVHQFYRSIFYFIFFYFCFYRFLVTTRTPRALEKPRDSRRVEPIFMRFEHKHYIF